MYFSDEREDLVVDLDVGEMALVADEAREEAAVRDVDLDLSFF